GPPLGPADALDHLRVLFLVAVAEVEPEDVRAGAEQLFEPLRAGGRRTDRGDDLDPPAAPDCFSHAAALPLMRESRAPQPKLTARQARIKRGGRGRANCVETRCAVDGLPRFILAGR